jgi:hypothetical protein
MIHRLFHDPFSTAQITQCQNEEIKRMWEEAVLAYFNVQFQRMPEGTEENRKNP